MEQIKMGEKKKRKTNIILPVGFWNVMARFWFCIQGTPPHLDPRNAREILIKFRHVTAVTVNGLYYPSSFRCEI